MFLRVLLFVCFLLPLDGALERFEFIKEWRRFVHKNQVDLTRIGTLEHLPNEFVYLEEFGKMQFHRRRPFVEGMDHDPRWIPFQENKVTLSNGSEMSASLIRFTTALQPGYYNFIASQAPKNENLHLFWQMIWEKEIDQIVMVTELQEPKKSLCPRYWPEKVGENLKMKNGVVVTLQKEEWLLSAMNERIQIHTLQVAYKGQVRQVQHYWYRNWLDGTAPSQIKTMMTLLEVVHREKKEPNVPILVHCHGGVGRTGTFIAIYHMLQRRLLNDAPISLFECVGYMRWQRPKLVSNPAQYYFCYGFLNAMRVNNSVR